MNTKNWVELRFPRIHILWAMEWCINWFQNRGEEPSLQKLQQILYYIKVRILVEKKHDLFLGHMLLKEDENISFPSVESCYCNKIVRTMPIVIVLTNFEGAEGVTQEERKLMEQVCTVAAKKKYSERVLAKKIRREISAIGDTINSQKLLEYYCNNKKKML